MAARSGSVDCIELLLKRGANIEAAIRDGRTAVHVAAITGQLLAVKYLLEKGAQGTATSDRRWLPLHDACFKGHVNIARFLLEQHPHTVNATTSESSGHWTPLHMAAQSGSVDCIELLLQYGANIETVTSDGRMSLSIAADNRQLFAMECLLAKGAQETVINNKYWLLCDACFKGNVDVAHFLLQNYPDIVNSTTTEEHSRWTPLHMAARSGSVDCIKLLLQYGENIEEARSDGSTSLHIAAYNGRLSAVKYLLKKGARGTATNHNG